MIGLYIPRIPTQGRYKRGSARIDHVSALWLGHEVREQCHKRPHRGYQAVAHRLPAFNDLGSVPNRLLNPATTPPFVARVSET